MALWQTSFLFLPKSLVAGYDEVSVEAFERIQDDLAAVAPDFALPPNYSNMIARLLPPAKGWHADMELWGDEKSDDICIWRDAGKLSSIGLRLDVRKLEDSLLEGVLALAGFWGCVLVERRYRKVCRMGVPDFRALICGHPHHRALQGLKAWLPVLAEEVRKMKPEANQAPATTGLVMPPAEPGVMPSPVVAHL
jgi:hypothetical protein